MLLLYFFHPYTYNEYLNELNEKMALTLVDIFCKPNQLKIIILWKKKDSAQFKNKFASLMCFKKNKKIMDLFIHSFKKRINVKSS